MTTKLELELERFSYAYPELGKRLKEPFIGTTAGSSLSAILHVFGGGRKICPVGTLLSTPPRQHAACTARRIPQYVTGVLGNYARRVPSSELGSFHSKLIRDIVLNTGSHIVLNDTARTWLAWVHAATRH